MLNRRMPNGMYGGVRGERKSPLLDFTAFGKMKDTADMLQQEEFTSMEYKELPAVQSELLDSEGCYLCGTAKESLMGYFR